MCGSLQYASNVRSSKIIRVNQGAGDRVQGLKSGVTVPVAPFYFFNLHPFPYFYLTQSPQRRSLVARNELNERLYTKDNFKIQKTFAFLPIRHVNGQKIKEIPVMPRVEKVYQLMKNNIFNTSDGSFVEIVIQIHNTFFATAASP